MCIRDSQDIAFEILKVGIEDVSDESIAEKVKPFISEIDLNARNEVHKDYDGETLLMMAARVCNIELFVLLMDSGADKALVEKRSSLNGYGGRNNRNTMDKLLKKYDCEKTFEIAESICKSR